MTVTNEPMYAGEFILSEAMRSRSRDQITIAQSQTLLAGTVLGATTVGNMSASAAALGSNTGNATFGNITAVAPAQAGVYDLTMGNATHFEVTGPGGGEVGQGALGSAFSAGGLGFTLSAGGVAQVPDDSWAITVGIGSAVTEYERLNNVGTDGSQNAAAIAFAPYTTPANVTVPGVAITRSAEVKSGALDWGNLTNTQIAAATVQLAKQGIIVR